MNTTRRLSALVGFVVGSLACFIAEPAHAQGIPLPAPVADQNIILLDITGSMGDNVAQGTTKFQAAKEQMATRIAEIKKRTLPQRFELRTVTMNPPGQTGTRVLAAFDQNKTVDEIYTMVGALTISDVGGTTPLAGAMCAAIEKSEELFGDYLTNNQATNRYLYVFSDGLENATPGMGGETADCDMYCTRCQGTDIDDATLTSLIDNHEDPAALQAIVPPGSWASKVFNVAMSNDPSNPGNGNYGNTVVDITMIFDFIKSASASDYGLGQVTAPWESFFGRLCQRTGGWYRGIKPNADGTYYEVTTPANMPIADITRDGCVGVVDYQKLMQSDTWNQTVRPDKPHLYAADIDHSGKVDIGDYRILSANYGKGTCKPGDL